jgi:hypothetical protein
MRTYIVHRIAQLCGYKLIASGLMCMGSEITHITQSTITLYKGHLTLTSDPSEGAGPCEPNIIMRAIKGPGPL